MGGLARRAALLKKLYDDNTLTGFDCGGYLDLDPAGGRNASICTLVGLARMGLEAAAVTSRDMFYGVDFLKTAADSAQVDLVCSNIIWQDTGARLFNSWVTYPIGDLQVAVTAIAHHQPGRRFPGLGTWTTVPPDSVIGSLRGSVPHGADLVILLTDLSEAVLRELLVEFPEIDVTLTSSRQVYNDSPFKVENCTVFHPRPNGGALEGFIFHNSKTSNSGLNFFSHPLTRRVTPDRDMNKWVQSCLEAKP